MGGVGVVGRVYMENNATLFEDWMGSSDRSSVAILYLKSEMLFLTGPKKVTNWSQTDP